MTKEDIIKMFKSYRENVSKLKIRKKELKRLIETDIDLGIDDNMSSQYGLNNDIRSQNKVGDKVLNLVIAKEGKDEQKNKRIGDLELEIRQLTDIVEDTELRLNSLYYREKEIIKAYYIDNRTAADVAINVFFQLFGRTCTEENIRKIADKAIERLARL